jgi:uncharacterized protein involved in outer membrane biogenesis
VTPVKKIILSFIVVIFVVVGGVVIGPTMIDWNAYKGDVSEKIKTLTGRDLKILGDVRVTIFPTPAIIANDISFSNMAGAAKTSMIKLRQVEVRIALSPLLIGQIKVETIRLIKPVIELELMADGLKNWEMKALVPKVKAMQPATKEVQVSGPSKVSVPAVVLNDFTIVDGVLNYRNSKLGTVERIEGLNAHVEAVSLIGPFQSKGSLTLRDTALTYDIAIGEVIKERTLPINLNLGISQGSASIQIGGNILDLSGAPKFKGDLKGEGKNLGLLIEAIRRESTPIALAQFFSINGNILASMQGVEINDLAVQVADSKIQGDISLEIGDMSRFSVNLSSKQVDLDKWLSTPKPEVVKEKAVTKKNIRVKGAIPVIQEQTTVQKMDKAIIPDDINGSVIISVEALLYRGKVINDIVINTKLKNGLARLSQFSAQFPGGSEMVFYGDLTASNGAPQFSGNIEATTNDLRKVTNWLDIEIPNIPMDRLRKIDFSSAITLKRDEIQVQGLKLKFDSSKLTGAATIALRSRPSFGANLMLDQINTDSYLPLPLKPKPLKAKQKNKPLSDKVVTDALVAKKVQNKTHGDHLFKGASILAGFDANILLEVKKLGFKGEKLRGVVVDALLYDGSLDIRKLNVAHFAGVTIATSGKIEGLRDIPSAHGLHINVKSKDLSPIAHLLGGKFSFDVARLGKASVDLRTNGSFLSPKIKASIKMAGVNINAGGKISVLPFQDAFNLKVNLAHPDLARLMRTFGSDYRPSGKIGGFSLALNLKGNPKSFAFEQVSGKIRNFNFSGIGGVDLSGSRPKITADLNVAALNLNPFFPATRKVGLTPKSWGALKHRPVVWPGPTGKFQQRSIMQISNQRYWSDDPIDLSILRALDLNIWLKSPLMTVSKYLFEKIDVSAEIRNGTLTTKRLKARLFGGEFQGNTKIVVGNTNQIKSTFNVSGIKISDALISITGKGTANGLLDANLNFTASGKSVSELVGSIGGTGEFAMKNVDVLSSVKGSAFSGIYNLLSSLKQLGSSRSRNQTDVDATFQIDQGIARTNDLKLASQLGNGVAAGTVDLVGWLLNMEGQIQLHQSALTKILQAQSKRGVSPVGFTLTGPLDSPNVKVDTRGLLGGSVSIPGADVLLKKAPKKVQRILEGLFSIGEPFSPFPAPTNGTPIPPGSIQQQEPKKLNARDLLKELLR